MAGRPGLIMRLASSRIIALLFCVGLMSGCAQKEKASKAIATVNGEPIYMDSLKRELSIMVKRDPSIEINPKTLQKATDMLIEKKIIIQEAMKKKMAEEKKFVDTMEAFWEQTLIRDFIEYKTAERERYVFVTDQEVREYYNNLLAQNAELPPFDEVAAELRWRLEQLKKAKAFEDWLEAQKKTSRISVDENAVLQLKAE